MHLERMEQVQTAEAKVLWLIIFFSILILTNSPQNSDTFKSSRMPGQCS